MSDFILHIHERGSEHAEAVRFNNYGDATTACDLVNRLLQGTGKVAWIEAFDGEESK
jgi:hypothetical protein